MGQTYTVEATLLFKNNDPAKFCEIIKNEIKKRDHKTAEFYADDYNLEDPFDCFKALTFEFAEAIGNSYYAEFDGSYGWESVMLEIFELAAQGLDNGSEILIYPDDGQHCISVHDDTIHIDSEN